MTFQEIKAKCTSLVIGWTSKTSLTDINIKISAEEAKLERTLKKSDVENYTIDALNSKAKTLIEILVERVTLYEHKIEISFKYSKNTNPDETLTEVHRDFLLYNQQMKITQRCFTAIFELNKWLSPIKSKTSRKVRLVMLWWAKGNVNRKIF